jgi:hypothetical protein
VHGRGEVLRALSHNRGQTGARQGL